MGYGLLPSPSITRICSIVERQGFKVPRLGFLLCTSSLCPAWSCTGSTSAGVAAARSTDSTALALCGTTTSSVAQQVVGSRGLECWLRHLRSLGGVATQGRGGRLLQWQGTSAWQSGASSQGASDLPLCQSCHTFLVSEARLGSVLAHTRLFVEGTHALGHPRRKAGRLEALSSMARDMNSILSGCDRKLLRTSFA